MAHLFVFVPGSPLLEVPQHGQSATISTSISFSPWPIKADGRVGVSSRFLPTGGFVPGTDNSSLLRRVPLIPLFDFAKQLQWSLDAI